MEGTRKKRPKRLLFILGAFLILLLAFLYYVIQRPDYFNPRYFISKMFLYVTSLIVIILILGVLFILFRNFVKLIVERRRGILGSKFRTKLVFIFFIPLLVPSIALFYAAMTIIQKSVENLLTPPVNDIAQYSSEIVDSFNDQLKQRSLAFAENLSSRITSGKYLDMDRRNSLVDLLDAKLKEYDVDLIIIYLSDKERVFQYDPMIIEKGGASESEISKFPDFLMESAMHGKSAESVDYLPKGYIVRGAVPILSSFNRTDVVGALLTGIYVQEDLAAKAIKIAQSRDDYFQMKVEKRNIKRIYIYIIALIALLILFSATWVGMFLTRQITVPIQKLAEGTREISSGNLEYQVDVDAGDELGMLVDSFNSMTNELRADKGILEERRKYIETLLDNITPGVISVNKNGEITTINKAAIKILNIGHSEALIGSHYDDLMKEEEIKRLRDSIRGFLGEENVSVSEQLLLTIRGRPLTIAANFLSLKDRLDRYLGMLIVIEDLTQLIRAQKMEAWREVAKRIAHEIKNPLTPIQLSAQRIMKKCNEGADDLKQTIADGASTIIGQVNTLKGMVDEFSKFARMPTIQPMLVDPHMVLDSAVSLYEAVNPGITFEKVYHDNTITVMMDPEQIKRAIINLIDNSIEAMNGNGMIHLETKRVEDAKVFRIELSDNGPGISSGDKDKLFIPYFSTKKIGTGLGLAIVQRIISDHNGVIAVEDNVPRGAKFIIDLPL